MHEALPFLIYNTAISLLCFMYLYVYPQRTSSILQHGLCLIPFYILDVLHRTCDTMAFNICLMSLRCMKSIKEEISCGQLEMLFLKWKHRLGNNFLKKFIKHMYTSKHTYIWYILCARHYCALQII